MKTLTDVSLLIVEDDEHFRESFVDAMALKGVKADGARCGLDAIDRLKRHTPTVIVIDAQLPDLHGFDLCRMIKKTERLKDVPVVFLSASSSYNDPRDRAEGLLVGGAAFFSKPITLEKLWAAIEPLV